MISLNLPHSRFRRIATATAAVTVLAASSVAVSTTAFARPLDRPADEGSAAVTSLHQTYACSVPEGYVFSDVRTKYSCSPGTTNGKEFLLLDYVNYNLSGVWSCQVPPGYTYTSIRTAYFCSPGTTSGQQFLLSG